MVGVRWDEQKVASGPEELPGMPALKGLVRSVRTPEFAGITFHEKLGSQKERVERIADRRPELRRERGDESLLGVARRADAHHPDPPDLARERAEPAAHLDPVVAEQATPECRLVDAVRRADQVPGVRTPGRVG